MNENQIGSYKIFYEISNNANLVTTFERNIDVIKILSLENNRIWFYDLLFNLYTNYTSNNNQNNINYIKFGLYNGSYIFLMFLVIMHLE